MRIPSPFEYLFGHVCYRATCIRSAITQCLGAFPEHNSVDAKLAAVANMHLAASLNDILHRVPEASALMRHYAEAPPTSTTASLEVAYEQLEEAQQEAVAATLFDAQSRWWIFRSIDSIADYAYMDKEFGRLLQVGEDEFAKLVEIDCLLGKKSLEEVQSFLKDYCSKWIAAMSVHFTLGTKSSVATSSYPQGDLLAVGETRYTELKQRRLMLVDVAAIDEGHARTGFEKWCRIAFLRTVASTDVDRLRYYWKAVTAEMAERFPWHPPIAAPRPISMTSPKDPVMRRATRVLGMVHELHKAGYQKIRISPGISANGGYWRCHITYSANVADDGFSIANFDVDNGLVALYSTGQDSAYFGWKDSAEFNAREMAVRFLREFPQIAEHGVGRDWLYAGWLTDALGRAEQGQYTDLVVLYGDYPIEEREYAAWQPPPPPR